MATNEFYIKSGNLVSESEWIKIIESLRTDEVIEDKQKAKFLVKEAVIEAVRKKGYPSVQSTLRNRYYKIDKWQHGDFS